MCKRFELIINYFTNYIFFKLLFFIFFTLTCVLMFMHFV